MKLPVEALRGAEEFLKYAHITATDIYPDVAGLARYLRKRHLSKSTSQWENSVSKGGPNAGKHAKRTGKRPELTFFGLN